MKELLKSLLRQHPRIFDWARRWQTAFSRKKDDAWYFFDEFSRDHSGRVTFLYIGANDGLRSDPIRYFIIRDGWQGILVEPLPDVFAMLQRNFQYLRKSNLVFVNAAISSSNDHLSFWTFDERFLRTLSRPERMDYLQKSSFDKGHVLRFLPAGSQPETVLKQIDVPCLTVGELARTRWSGPPINLLVIDAEGHEASIIPSIDFSVVAPEAIYFESHNLGPKKADVYGFLTRNGFAIRELGGDSVAIRQASRT